MDAKEILWIKKHGIKAQGKKEYIEYLETDKKLPPRKAILANCYQCMNSYLDGRVDCEIMDCPLYSYMPYRRGMEKMKKVLSEKQQESVQKLAILRSATRKAASGKI
jgi:hypothetical protein